jgi:hypothetical protein
MAALQVDAKGMESVDEGYLRRKAWASCSTMRKAGRMIASWSSISVEDSGNG